MFQGPLLRRSTTLNELFWINDEGNKTVGTFGIPVISHSGQFHHMLCSWFMLVFMETDNFSRNLALAFVYWLHWKPLVVLFFNSSNKKANFFGSKRLVARGLARYQPLATKWRISVCGLIEGLLIDTVSDHQSLRLEFRVIRCGPHRSEFGRINNMHILDPSTPAPSDAIPNLLSLHHSVHSKS